MKIPIFLSCPRTLTASQTAIRAGIVAELDKWGLEPRTIGVSDYAVDAPLKEILVLARHCAGGLILGFKQTHVTSGTHKPSTNEEKALTDAAWGTPWNQIEAGVLFALGLPMLLLRESSVVEGIFDLGSSGLFVQSFDEVEPEEAIAKCAPHVERWHSRVREHYYRT